MRAFLASTISLAVTIQARVRLRVVFFELPSGQPIHSSLESITLARRGIRRNASSKFATAESTTKRQTALTQLFVDKAVS